MRSFLVVFLVAGIFLSPLELSAQQRKKSTRVKNLSPKEKMEQAMDYLDQGLVFNAIDAFHELLEENPYDTKAQYKLAISYMAARNYSDAVVWFEQVLKNDEEASNFKELPYYYGDMLMMSGRHAEAIIQFEEYLSQTDNDPETELLRNMANIKKEGCELAQPLIKQPLRLVVSDLPGVNRAYNEYSPMPLGDSTILYASLRSDTLILFKEQEEITDQVKFYTARKKMGEWKEKGTFKGPFNELGSDNANGAFSPDKKRFYFTRCREEKDGQFNCGIYLSEKLEKDKWSEPFRLGSGINGPDFNSTQPSIREFRRGQEMLYFSSNREGGMGGYDLYYTVRTIDGTFKAPAPVAGAANTLGDEFTPFFDDEEQTLYFSSTGHPGIGGIDIFKMKLDEYEKWDAVEHLGYPINTWSDDFYYVNEEGAKGGYFVSNRPGSAELESATCCDNIYEFQWVNNFIRVIAYDQEDVTRHPLDEVTTSIHLLTAGDPVFRGSDVLEAGSTRKGSVFNVQPDGDHSISCSKEGYEHGLVEITPNQIESMDTFLVYVPLFKKDIHLIVKTFERKEDQILELSGVDVKLIDLGNQKLLAKESTKAFSKLSYSIRPMGSYNVQGSKKSYFTGNVDFNTLGKMGGDTMTVDVVLEKIRMDKAYSLKNIYYDFDKATLRPESTVQLDTLFVLLETNPRVVIELSSHTDSKGSDAYNLRLSQQRAESCVNYLIAKGIPSNRITPKGYGESKPIAANSYPDGKDNPEGRQMNRRTEFRVIGELEDKDLEIKYEDTRYDDGVIR